MRGGPNGDLYIFVHLARHSVFQREGTTLFVRCPVSITTAALDHAVTLTRIPPSNGLVWSADGQWLFWVTDTGTLRAWQRGSAQPQDVGGAGHIPALDGIALAA